MPAVDTISRGPIGHQGRMDNSGLLVETMQYEEPRKSQHVPNHLLETKIYTKIAQNSMVMAKPSVIHFGGFEVDKKQTIGLSIVNVSTEVIRMHIVPPQTKYFYIKYTKNERLVPGLTLECTLEFTPDEWRYYYDCIRINCPGEENLVIPIHAYPVMSTKDFPQLFNFPPVPVGHKMTKVFPLRCEAPIDFEYQLTYLQPHQAFSVHPMTGIIPANGETEVSVTFSPIEFHTAYMRVQLVISQFNSSPIVCTFTGTSLPGLLKAETLKGYTFMLEEADGSTESLLDPRSITPMERARKKKKKVTLPEPTNVKTEIEYQGLKFSTQLDTPYAVAQVLNQEPGKMRAKDLREVVVTKDSKPKVATRQMKEAKFEHAVRQNVYEERQNQLRWQSKLGDEQMTTEQRAKVLSERNKSWNIYKYKRCGEPIEDEEYVRQCTHCTFKRTLRDKNCLGAEDAQFDKYTNDMWHVRHKNLSRFAQAARKVIIRRRAEDKLQGLKKMVDEWKQKQVASESLTDFVDRITEVTAEQKDKISEDQKKELKPVRLELSADKIKRLQFPTYVPPNVKDDMAPDALGSVPFKPTEVVVKRKVPYFALKVPLQYKLNSYKAVDVQDSASGYVPLKMSKPLRTGAEDEVIILPSPVFVKERSAVHVDARKTSMVLLKEGASTLQEAKPIQAPVISLTPPQALFQPMEYPPLHIFNPAPGLQVFQAPVPYAETDPDFHLCPLPRYTRRDHATNVHAATQRRYLDREDVVRGIMTWKKFPSQGLTSLSNTPTLTNVWVPRWDDPFGSDLLPLEGPAPLETLPSEDAETILDDEDEEGRSTSRMAVNLTPEMVNAQFVLIDPSTPTDEKVPADAFPHGNRMPATNIPVSAHGPVARENREAELEYFMTKKYNKLGAKIESRNQTLNHFLTNKNLQLK
ncbi:cilia- and flagella-associated protein 221-like isoform X2 [Dreissena polymorpha]|uniref:cilia- and flagella-associated protein 221-like isoform X2 n=1 Tax=Dreissena polymorpha TaxID=45954 RepID=UPI002264C8A4|nr:cilia- and flagella-associated protein 221-like isoform X2 [Dreissena polymorpha]